MTALDYTHAIIGAGAVGLAIGARLSRAGYKVLLLEKNAKPGEETSSRNSEVIHAGLYHPPDSLKSKLCIRGKQLIYEAHKNLGLGDVKRCGKWIIAQTPEEAQYLHTLKKASLETGVPLEFISLNKAREIEPSVIAQHAVLDSSTTGIISADTLMRFYEAELQENEADLVTHTAVESIEPIDKGYKLRCMSGNDKIDISVASVINAAGLWAPRVAQMLGLSYSGFYAKGNYFAYTRATPKVSRLIYPCPSDKGSLGTHLTIDLAGSIRFGPDFEWVETAEDYKVNMSNIALAKKAILRYINIDADALVPSYSGIRPKLSKDVSRFQDFIIKEEPQFPGFINLLGIESPGLTASMAIAEYVHDLIK